MMQSLLSACICLALLLNINKTFAADDDCDKGAYKVLYVKPCPDAESYPMKMDITKRKHNRSHDSFDGWLDFDRDLTAAYSMRADICQETSSGCKPFYELRDNSMCGFLEKYGKENINTVLSNHGLTTLCPITMGRHEMSQPHIMNYETMPDQGVCGTYDVKAYLLNGDEEIGCTNLGVQFVKVE